MFTPATKKSHLPPQRSRKPAAQAAPDSPSTPAAESRFSVASRPATGTPVPWASRLSVLARISNANRTHKGADADQTQPVHVAEFPQVLRNAQAIYLQKNIDVFFGGMDKGSSLSWMICGNQLFIWSFLSASVPKKCVTLDIPASALAYENKDKNLIKGRWLVCFVKWEVACAGTEVFGQCPPVGVVACNEETGAILYWPDIFSESMNTPVVSLPDHEESDNNASPHQEITETNGNQESNQTGDDFWSESKVFNSLIVSPIPGTSYDCIGLALSSSGVLWRLHFSSSKICRERFTRVVNCSSFQNSEIGQPSTSRVYARSLVWRFQHETSEKSSRQFFLLTDNEIQCWNILLEGSGYITKLWSHEIIGADGGLGIKKDLAGQKHIWLLDMQIDDRGREFTILVATFCKDRVSSSSYTQYSLLTMQYKSGYNISSEDYTSTTERILEKKAPLQVIIPKARVEDEKFLFSLRLRVGGKPPGSALILSGDGTATVANYCRGSTHLYQFDLPWDAGKVLDASVIPPMEDNEDGAWIVLTEKAGIWAIPEKAVLLGGVEPPERSLSRKGSSNERAPEEEKYISAFDGGIVPRRTSSEAWNTGERQRAVLSSYSNIAQRIAQDEEAEALLGRLFHDFLLTGKVEGAFEKLKKSGAFEKEGAVNVFARMSKSIVDTLAKHWTTTRGADFMVSAVVSSQLSDKQQKHERFLQFLALSKCHEELSSKQRHSLHIILEHGEKLAGMVQLRELQNLLSQKRSVDNDSPSSPSGSEVTGSLWDLIQLVGEKARRNAVLLMDRDNAEVFYSRVSDLEELFYCLSHDLHYIIDKDHPSMVQIQRTCEISNACISLIDSAMRYRNDHQTWYASPEGLIHWNCKPVVRSGLWSMASLIIQLLREAPVIDKSIKFDLSSQLEGLADVLLETYNALIIVKMERGEEYKGLGEEYFKRRDEILRTLYQQLKEFVSAKSQAFNQHILRVPGRRPSGVTSLKRRWSSSIVSYPCSFPSTRKMGMMLGSGDGGRKTPSQSRLSLIGSVVALDKNLETVLYKENEDPELKKSVFKEASGHLLAIAKQHEGYETLWDICYDLNDTELLRNLMRQSMGPQGGFSYFVFKKLYEQHKYSTLLRLGEEFQEDLLIFLKQHTELLWLHQQFLNQFTSASETLHALALYQDYNSTSVAEEASNPDYSARKPSLSERRRFLNLSKIAAAAGKDVGFDIKIQQIEADLHMLKLQALLVSGTCMFFNHFVDVEFEVTWVFLAGYASCILPHEIMFTAKVLGRLLREDRFSETWIKKCKNHVVACCSTYLPKTWQSSVDALRRIGGVFNLLQSGGSDSSISFTHTFLIFLFLQEEIVGQLNDSETMQDLNKPLHPGGLIELCLKSRSRKLSLLAFEIFAWTSASFRMSNRSLLVECWMNAADQDDWSAVYQKSIVEGWGDEVSLQFLKETVLFQASKRCFGPGVDVYDGGFENALPCQEEDVQPAASLKDSCSSVEGILMQHKDFPDAGKLMVTAIVMGKAGADAIISEDVMADVL
ncbi:hypothetical protein Taro_027453 [Colocasia esculenta]|uniref:Nucleoporin Nup133/Nup155-like N-terminal domain-containing protein n=1 Tax=Colocasia esculenta TaxID=4460 RepID=A0A843VEJ6_COLES|nr:hypothetical protein [Colocasia esculenta]